jgi:hypothetical protein
MAILFKNGRVIIGNGEVIERGTVVVNGNQMILVGPDGKFKSDI